MTPIVLVLPYPISANRYWQTRVVTPKGTRRPMAMTYVSTEAKQYKSDVEKIAQLAGVKSPIDWRCDTVLELYPHRPLDWQKRQRVHGEYWDDTVQCIDLGNCEKVLSDALQGIIFTDDKWIWDMHKRRMEPDERGARIVVTITPRVRAVRQSSLLEAG